jgi:hypothetical protein
MVVDSNDPSRLGLAREELHKLCADEVSVFSVEWLVFGKQLKRSSCI